MKLISPIVRILSSRAAIKSGYSFRQFAATSDNSNIQLNEQKSGTEEEEPWKNPYKQVLPEKATYSEYREVDVNWEYVRRLLPRKIIPEVSKPEGTVTPSGWRAPKAIPPDSAYYIRRGVDNMPELFLERRRDRLNPKTMEFEYVELVTLKNIHGDIFACERDLREYVEKHLGHPVATHVDELKGLIKVKGADRTLIEQFVYDFESGFTLCPN